MQPPRAARPPFAPPTLAAWFACGAMLCFAGAAAAQDEPRVAVVDVAKIFLGYYKTREFDARIAEARSTYEDEMDRRSEEHHRLVEELARIDKDLGNPALGDPARASRQTQREKTVEQTHQLEQETREFKASRERSIEELTVRERTQIVEDIIAVLDTQVESKHYDLILNKSAQVAGGKIVVLYANGSLDITGSVLAALNKDHPDAKPIVPPAPPKG